MNRADLTANQQTAMLADRYTQRADAYEALWSPIIRPVGERLIARLPLSSTTMSVVDIGTGAGALLPAIKCAAPSAVIVGVDRSQGMLRLAKDKHRLSAADGEQYLYQGDVFMATALKADHPSDNC